MKIKKIILNGLWILILLFAFGGMPQKLLADNKGKLMDPKKTPVFSQIPAGPSTDRNCLNFGKTSVLVPYTNGCPSNIEKIKFFPNAKCEGKEEDPDILAKAVTVISSGLGTSSGVPGCHWNARQSINSPYWYVITYQSIVACKCNDYTVPFPFACTAAQLNNPPWYCAGLPVVP